MKFIEELKRRNIFNIAGAYLVMGWLLIESSGTLGPMMGLPDNIQYLIFQVMGFAFPIVLIFSWLFEFTDEGIKRTADVSPATSRSIQTGKKLEYFIIVALAAVIILLIIDREQSDPEDMSAQITQTAIKETIAVLPFVNMSSDPEQEYFSDGISEELLNVLVKIPELKVAGRTSSFAYKNHNQDLREIGAALGVQHILEGSVRKSGTSIRITAQLVRTDDGFHLWSETYDRELVDIFNIQDEISRAIAEALSVSLGLGEEASLVNSRTEIPEAYEAYLRARQLYNERGLGLKDAVINLAETLVYDPDFVPAWALLAKTYSIYPYYVSGLTNESWRKYLSLTVLSAERALQRDPNSAEALVALANAYREQRQFVKSYETYERAIALAPRDPDAHQQFAELLLILGYLEEGKEQAMIADDLNPGLPVLMNVVGWAHLEVGEYDQAIEILTAAEVIDPSLPTLGGNIIAAQLMMQGDPQVPLATFERLAESGMAYYVNNIEFARKIFSTPDILSKRDDVLKIGTAMGAGGSLENLLDTSLPEALEASYLDYSYAQLFSVTAIMRAAKTNDDVRQIVQKFGIVEAWQALGPPDGCVVISPEEFYCE